MGEGYWVVRTYEGPGAVGEKIKFFVSGARPERRSRKREKDAEKKIAQNRQAAVREAARVIHANYRAGDYLVGLDYDPEGLAKVEAWAEQQSGELSREDRVLMGAERELQLCIRRVRRELAKRGIQLRYHLAVTSDMDGDTGETVRVHHHLIVNRRAAKVIREKWTLGGVSLRKLRRQPDYTPIAEYLIKQVRHRQNEKAYLSSKNLVRPQPKDRVALSGAELRVPRGGKLLYRGAVIPGFPQYIRYELPPEKQRMPMRDAEGEEASTPVDA